MKSQIDVSTIVDAVYQTVFDLTADIHQARWDAYWTLTTLIYPGIDEAPPMVSPINRASSPAGCETH